MTNKGLLELAAKAIGCEVEFTSGAWTFGEKTECRLNGGDIWNPLTDDGDALRLAVKLNMLIVVDIEGASTQVVNVGFFDEKIREGHDKYVVTRRAIVRAAAEIGKTLG